jgi:DNA primase
MNTQIERIKDNVLIENVLDRYGIRHSHGRCCCPIHDGNNPTSFSFNDQVFHCHSCGASGDVFQLIQHLERVEFKESLKLVAAMAGITVEDCLQRG